MQEQWGQKGVLAGSNWSRRAGTKETCIKREKERKRLANFTNDSHCHKWTPTTNRPLLTYVFVNRVASSCLRYGCNNLVCWTRSMGPHQRPGFRDQNCCQVKLTELSWVESREVICFRNVGTNLSLAAITSANGPRWRPYRGQTGLFWKVNRQMIWRFLESILRPRSDPRCPNFRYWLALSWAENLAIMIIIHELITGLEKLEMIKWSYHSK